MLSCQSKLFAKLSSSPTIATPHCHFTHAHTNFSCWDKKQEGDSGRRHLCGRYFHHSLSTSKGRDSNRTKMTTLGSQSNLRHNSRRPEQSLQNATNNASKSSGSSNGSDFDPVKRLCWPKYKGFWWPAIYYESLEEFNCIVMKELDENGDLATKMKLSLHLMDKALALKESSNNQAVRSGVVRFIGLSIYDYEIAEDLTYRDFFNFLPTVVLHIIHQTAGVRSRQLPVVYGISSSHGFSNSDYGRKLVQKVSRFWKV